MTKILSFTLLGLLLAAGGISASVPPAGFDIFSRSQAEYVLNAAQSVSFSNQVSTTVSPVYDISIAPPGSIYSPAYDLQGYAGDTVYCSFILRNYGNARDSLSLNYTTVPPSGFTPKNIVFFHDLNSNGFLDGGESFPPYFVIPSGDSAAAAAAVIFPDSADSRVSFDRIEAVSLSDVSAADESAIKMNFLGQLSSSIFIGPAGNPLALPGGDNSPDDVTVIRPFIHQTSVTFVNEIFNKSSVPDVVTLNIPQGAGAAPQLSITFLDTSGALIPQSPLGGDNFLLGIIGGNETKKVLVNVSGSGEPISRIIGQSLSIPVKAVSLIDSTRENTTVDRIDAASEASLSAVISIKQTFKQQTAAGGDIVTLLIDICNLSDSVRVDNIVVSESYQDELEFLSSPDFKKAGGGLAWSAGSLNGRGKKSANIKFLCAGRLSRGKVKASGKARGVTEFSDNVSAGPAVSILGIDNDIFAAEGIIFGDVFVDRDEDGIRSVNEEGIAGAAVYLDSGEYALTDSLGKFTLPRVFSGYRVVRLDESTIPADFVSKEPAEEDQKASSMTRLVHLLEGGNAALLFPFVKRLDSKTKAALVERQITCQEKVSIQKKSRMLYQTLSVPSSHFETGKSYLKSYPVDKLRSATPFILSHPGWRILLEGHTDSIPIHTREFPSNYELSLARAGAVKNFLTANGVPPGKISIRGCGSERPLASNAAPEGRALNRRVELLLVPPGVSKDDAKELERVKMEMNSIPASTDTFKVDLIWNFSTDSPHPMDLRLALTIPDCFSAPGVEVFRDGMPVEEDGTAYIINGFRRSSGLDVRMEFLAADGDTLFINKIKANFTLKSPVLSRGSKTGSKRPLDFRNAVLSPLTFENSKVSTKVFSIIEWQEELNTPTAASADGSGSVSMEPPANSNDGDAKGAVLVRPQENRVYSKRDRITVEGAVPLGGVYSLWCNGEEVSEKIIGKKIIDTHQRKKNIIWYGVKIRKGWNRLVLNAAAADGRIMSDSINVALSGRPALLECLSKRVLIPADGRSGALVRFAVKDRLGLSPADGMMATIIKGDSLANNADACPDMRGLQVMSSNGHFEIGLKSSSVTGRSNLVLELGGLAAGCPVSYIPARRLMLMSGIIQAHAGVFNKTGPDRVLGIENYGDGPAAGGKSRLFLQGTTYGGMNLTLRMDSHKRYEDQLLKSINPDRGYSFYGDASQLNFAAPAVGGNYVALEKNESFVRYGDFKASLSTGEFLRYSRALNGVNAALVNAHKAFKGFVTKTDFITCKDEIQADGTSGYYYLRKSPLVENSEKIVLETRDRYQPEHIIDVRPLIQNRDYTMNYFDGSLLFKEPIPVFDRGFNPVYIVAIYEIRGRDTQERPRYLYGLSGNISRGGAANIHLSAVKKEGEGRGYSLYGFSAKGSAAGVSLLSEFARSEDEIAGEGNAYKIETSFNREKSGGSLYFRKIDGDFQNPSFSGSSHELASEKIGYEVKAELGPMLTMKSAGYKHQLDKTGERRGNIEGLLEFAEGGISAAAGFRYASEKKDSIDTGGVLGVFGVGAAKGPAAIKTVWEKNLVEKSVDDYPDRLRTSFSLGFLGKYKVEFNHEYLTSAYRGASHQARLGIASKFNKNGSVYAKYSMDRTASSERLGAVTGLKQGFQLNAETQATFGVENYHSLSRSSENYLAAKTGLSKIKRQSRILEAQYEFRRQAGSNRHFLRMNGARQFAGGTSVLFKNIVSYTSGIGNRDAVSFSSRIAMAKRPEGSMIKGLVMLKNIYERYSPIEPEAITWKLVLSADANVIPAARYEARFKYAIKYVEDYSMGVSSNAATQLVLTQFIYRFMQVWDTDVWARLLRRTRGKAGLGSGFEIGRTFRKFVRISAGYSINGFEDRDLAENDAWQKGFGVRIQLILSELVLKDLGNGS